MKLIFFRLFVFFLGVTFCLPALGATNWVFTLADTVWVSSAGIQLSDLTTSAFPVHLDDLLVGYTGMPGEIKSISRQTILRKLVTSGQSRGVSFRGANTCVVMRTGETLNPDSLRPEIRKALQHLVPSTKFGAPANWFELQLPQKLEIVDDPNFQVHVYETAMLEPGRNQISIILDGTDNKMNFPVIVTLHQFGETARARIRIKRGDILIPGLFDWEWFDLANEKRKTDFFGKGALSGVSCTRTIQAGDYLRQCDLKLTPIILSGDRVELQVQRGSVTVSVNATARQEGCVGQTIPVRNELTKQLVNARIMGPGIVKWRN